MTGFRSELPGYTQDWAGNAAANARTESPVAILRPAQVPLGTTTATRAAVQKSL